LKSGTDDGVIAVVVATGIATVAAQLVLVREYLAQFSGNEIVIALIFFDWLVFGGIGSSVASGARRWMRPARPAHLGLLASLLPILALVQVVAIRRLRDPLFLHGVSVGFYPTAAFIALTLWPMAVLTGYLLPYSLRVIRRCWSNFPGNRIYLADNLGDVAGAAVFTLALVGRLTPLQLLAVAHLPLLAALTRLSGWSRRRAMLSGLAAMLVLVAGALCEVHLLPLRQGRRVLYAESRYGRIEAMADTGAVTLFNNGQPLVYTQDPAMAEEIVHIPLSQVDSPRRILLISAVGGIMAEVAKYHPQGVDYVEIDPMLAAAQRQFGLVAPIPGMRVVNADGRAFLAGSTTRYDAILVSLSEPETYQTNRFFTAGFFELAKRHLHPGGVLSFGATGVADYISDDRAAVLACLANTAKRSFRQVTVFPGQRLIFVCRDGAIRTDIPEYLAQRGIATDYIRRYFAGDVTGARIRLVNQRLDPHAPLNLDLAPTLMRLAFLGWFARHGESPLGGALVLGVATLACLIRLTRARWVLLTSGCVNIGAEMVCIFTFQIYFGYVYFQIGALVTVFLAGLFPGAWLGGRFRGHRVRGLMAADGALCLLMGAFAGLLVLLGQDLPVTVFYLFGLALSVGCGFQFPLVLAMGGDTAAAAAGSFSADLLGAAAGVLLVSLVLIPFFGLVTTTLCLAGLKLVSLLVAGGIHESS
jgi:spermidine synthase